LLEECFYDFPGTGGYLGCDTRVANTDRDLGTLESEGLLGVAIEDAVTISRIDRKNVYVTSYVSYFNTENDCPIFLTHLNTTFRNDLNAKVRRLNTAISTQALRAGVNSVDLDRRFDTHRWCDSSTTWFNGLLGADQEDVSDKLASGSSGGGSAPNSVQGIFHTTADGQKAYANEILSKLGLPDIA